MVAVYCHIKVDLQLGALTGQKKIGPQIFELTGLVQAAASNYSVKSTLEITGSQKIFELTEFKLLKFYCINSFVHLCIAAKTKAETPVIKHLSSSGAFIWQRRKVPTPGALYVSVKLCKGDAIPSSFHLYTAHLNKNAFLVSSVPPVKCGCQASD